MDPWQCDGCSTHNDAVWGACTRCRDLRPVDVAWPTRSSLILLYVGDTQVDATARYLGHEAQLAPFGYRPVATSWGEERPGAARAFFLAHLEEARRIGTLLVTYTRDPAEARS